MSAKVWSGVSVAIQSALGTAVTITAITKASTAVATYSGADTLVDGDYIFLGEIVGMHQLDDRVVRVAGRDTAANTIQLEGVDSTLFDTFSSGSVQKITFGTALSIATGVAASGGEFEFIDTTTIHSNTRTRIPGVSSPISLSFTCQWDPEDAALIALKSASDAKAKRAIIVTFSDAAKFLFAGHVGASIIPTGGAQELVTTTVVIEGSARPTAYAT